MMRTVAFAALALAAAPLAAGAEPLDGSYRGTIVCEKLKDAADILRAPFDMVVSGKTVAVARPVFNRTGTRTLGSEVATGSIEESGAVKLNSRWSMGGFSFEGTYSGSINAKVGTLIGTQNWTMPRGKETRSCTVAFVHRS